MDWMSRVNGDPFYWLLEPDPENPGVRFFALQEFSAETPDRADIDAARQAVMDNGPVPAILAGQNPEGYWVTSGAGYRPKYTGTVWSVMFLAQLGADGTDERVRAGCEYLLEHARSPLGGFSIDGGVASMVQCLQGNLCAALIDLGWLGDPRLSEALDWLARSVTGEGIAPVTEKTVRERYASGNCGPGDR